MNSNDSSPPPAPSASEDALSFALLNEIGIIAQLSSNLLEKVMPGEMKVSQFVVLNHFVRLGGQRTPQELARIFQVSKGAMTNTLQRLEAQDFISLAPDASDGRSKRVAITSAGIEARGRAIEALAPHLKRMEERFNEAELQTALPLLRELRQWLGTQRDDLA